VASAGNKRIGNIKGQMDSGSITGCKADEKFAIEGTSTGALKEKSVGELARQQQIEAIEKQKLDDPYSQNTSQVIGQKPVRASSDSKYSPFRSQRTGGSGIIGGNGGTTVSSSIQQNGLGTLGGYKNSVGSKCVKLIKPDPNLIRRLLTEEKDERYRYLLRHGNVLNIESETLTLYVELP